MKNILLATHNKGKIKRYKALFKAIENLKIITLEDLGVSLKVDEPFNTPLENSAHKARQYGEFTNLTTIAIDEAVLTNFLPDNEQPGVFVRRLSRGKDLSDIEVLQKWKKIFSRYPLADKKFIWDFSLSCYNPKNKDLQTVEAVQINTVAKEFSNIINPGYPMSSFLIPDGLNKTYSELNEEESLLVDKKTLQPFFEFISKMLVSKDNSNLLF